MLLVSGDTARTFRCHLPPLSSWAARPLRRSLATLVPERARRALRSQPSPWTRSGPDANWCLRTPCFATRSTLSQHPCEQLGHRPFVCRAKDRRASVLALVSASAAAWGNDVHAGWRGQQPSSCVCQANSLTDLRKIAKFHKISTHHPAGTAPDGRRAAGAWQPSSRAAPLERYAHGPHRDHALFIQHLVEGLGACRRARRHRPPRSRRQIRRQVQVRSVDHATGAEAGDAGHHHRAREAPRRGARCSGV